MQTPYSITFFDGARSALEYRRANGTGGFIFLDLDSGEAMLFPAGMLASEIFIHAVTRNRNGKLFP